MSACPVVQAVAGLAEVQHERRQHCRYSINTELEYRLMRRGLTPLQGKGAICDLSTGGVLFEADRFLELGLAVELSVKWPVIMDPLHPLRLRVIGKVVRTKGTMTAVQISRYEFCTRAV